MRPRLIIDDTGVLHHSASQTWRRHLGSTLHEQELIEFAVRNLGYAAMSHSPQSARIWMRPKIINPIAFAATVQWLTELQINRCCLSLYTDKWADTLYGELGSTIQAMVDQTLDATLTEGYSREELPLDQLDPGSPLALLLKRVQEMDYLLDLERLQPLLHAKLGDRYVVVEPTKRAHIIAAQGSGLRILEDGAHRQPLGSRLQDLYDCRFGRWGSQAYTLASKQQRPRLDKIDAVINLPRQKRTRVHYTRMIIPVHRADGSPLLLGASVLDRSLPVSVEPAQEA